MTPDASATGHDHAALGHAPQGGFEDRATVADVSEHDSTRTCSACASCCVGVGLVSYPASLEFGRVPEAFANLVGSDRPAYLTGGLERPPRPFLA